MKFSLLIVASLASTQALTLNQLSQDGYGDCLHDASQPFCDRRGPEGGTSKLGGLSQSPPIAQDPKNCINDKSKPFCDRREAAGLSQSPPIAEDPDHCVNDKSKPFCDRRAPAETMAK